MHTWFYYFTILLLVSTSTFAVTGLATYIAANMVGTPLPIIVIIEVGIAIWSLWTGFKIALTRIQKDGEEVE